MLKITLAFAALLGLLCGCANAQDRASSRPAETGPVLTPPERDAVAQLAWLDTADPVADARRAIAMGNRTLVVPGSRGASPPGVPAEHLALALRHCPARLLPGVTDTVYGPTHLRYLAKARDYARHYNRTMLAVCVAAPAAAPR